jgi:hypothetical protein
MEVNNPHDIYSHYHRYDTVFIFIVFSSTVRSNKTNFKHFLSQGIPGLDNFLAMSHSGNFVPGSVVPGLVVPGSVVPGSVGLPKILQIKGTGFTSRAPLFVLS